MMSILSPRSQKLASLSTALLSQMSFDEMAAKAFKVSSFTSVGHLLHINLKEHLIPHKHQIGSALLEKNPRALAVVNKVNNIDNTYRNFDIEVIAKREGCEKSDDELMLVEVNENKCRFQLDFSKVYWNSRLSTEHERIIGKLRKGIDIVYDLFAGVGPFAVPAAKSKCKTYANDLNPESIKWLNVNMKRNKVPSDMYEIHNMDAEDFILKEMKSRLLADYQQIEDEELATMPAIHIIMNLPALAPIFLRHFVGLFKENQDNKDLIDHKELLRLYRKLSIEHIVHCYCFLKGVFESPESQVKSMIEKEIGRELNSNQIIEIFRVRNVAPYKEMYRVDIRLDENLLLDQKNPISIMRNLNGVSSNGTTKKVTIQAPNNKRGRDDDDNESVGNDIKKTRFSAYCNII